MKVGIYTIHAAHNYGAMLQAYATVKAVENAGHRAELVNLYTPEEEKANKWQKLNSLKDFILYSYARISRSARRKIQSFRAFHNAMPLSKRYYSPAELSANPPRYDLHLVGSDQTWNLENGFSEYPVFFLSHLKSEEKRIAYAPSFGTTSIKDEYRKTLKKYLTPFQAISVRETAGQQILTETGIASTQVMDPTFLVEPEQWSRLAGERPLITGDYLLFYGFGDNPQSRAIHRAAKEWFNIPTVGLSVGLSTPFKYDHFYRSAGPVEFLNLAKHAKFIITASYHGAAFAIHFRKDFYITAHHSRNSRMETMLSRCGLSDRMVCSLEEINNITKAHLPVTYRLDLIRQAAEESQQWLYENIR